MSEILLVIARQRLEPGSPGESLRRTGLQALARWDAVA
jgi:hypothetical protein